MSAYQTYAWQIQGTIEGQTTINTFFLRAQDEDAPEDTNAILKDVLMDYIETEFLPDWRAVCHPAYEVQFINMIRVNNVLGDAPYVLEIGSRAIGLPGQWNVTGGIDVMPSHVALLVHKYYARQTKNGRSTTYIPGVPENAADGSSVNAAMNTAITGLLNNLMDTPLVGSVPEQYQVHFGVVWDPSPISPENPNPAFSKYESVRLGQVLGTQRRRRLGVGV